MGAHELSELNNPLTSPSKHRGLPLYYVDEEDNTPASPPPSKRNIKRKRGVDELEYDGDSVKKKGRRSAKKGKDTGEKRLGRHRSHAPQSHTVLLERAQTQRMFVIERRRTGTSEEPNEVVEIAGSTGNLYTVTISKTPTCNCPYAAKGNECKHIVYVLNRTLKAPANLQYQRYLLSSELREIFDKAPPIPADKGKAEADDSGARKPIEDDCPICCVEFDPEHEDILYCKAACGNNVHKKCFEQWAVQKRATGGGVTCPFCRTPWERDATDSVVDKNAAAMKDGYMNVASQLGLSGLRDTSSYHQYWVRRERKNGGLQDEDPNTALGGWRRGY